MNGPDETDAAYRQIDGRLLNYDRVASLGGDPSRRLTAFSSAAAVRPRVEERRRQVALLQTDQLTR